jgi:hypothetical protein
MDYVWFRSDKGSYRYREWYIRLSSGESLRSQKSNFVITKKIAAHFETAPEDYSVEEALMWGIVLNQGGDDRLAIAFIAARPSGFYKNLEFWNSLIRYFAVNRMIARNQVGPVVDFINYQKFDSSEIYENGEIIRKPPPQPNFSLNKRKPETLLKLVDKWHGIYKKLDITKVLAFEKSRVNEYKGLIDNTRVIQIRQLTSNYALFEEGQELRHCAGSYVTECQNNNCSIWSLSIGDTKTTKKILTIEINRLNMIVQIAGACNRYPTLKELKPIEKWAKKENVSFSKFIRYTDN